MNILILQRVPFQFIKYDEILDHDLHDVVYVGKSDQLETVPPGLRCTKVVRPGVRSVADEVIDLFRQGPRFDRVVSMSQYEALEAARVREALGVAGQTCADVLRADHKVEMKRAVLGKGLRAPRFMTCTAALEGAPPSWTGRTVLKPVDGTASKDVHVFDTYDDAVRAASANAPGIADFDPRRFELEEFVDGPILHYDGLMLNGELVAGIASKYLGTCLGFAHGEPLGSVQTPERTALRAPAMEFVHAVGIRNGPFHLEMIDAEGGLAFLEVAARAGGAGVVDVFQRATGIDLDTAALVTQIVDPLAPSIDVARITPRAQSPDDPSFGWFLFPGHKVGAVHATVEGGEAWREHPCVLKWTELPPGRALPAGVTYFDFELPLSGILRGNTSSELEAFMTRIMKEVRVVPAT
jgi:hypothetical protein